MGGRWRNSKLGWHTKIKNRTAEFAEKGRRVGGGLKNGDLLIASKVRSIHFTDDDVATPQIVPCGLFVQLFRKKLREKQFVSANSFQQR
ncbi:MAG: hypothetical protein IIV65_08820 [Alistipes sp.]|nr:hypothetical protein [Alistipes sp.]